MVAVSKNTALLVLALVAHLVRAARRARIAALTSPPPLQLTGTGFPLPAPSARPAAREDEESPAGASDIAAASPSRRHAIAAATRAATTAAARAEDAAAPSTVPAAPALTTKVPAATTIVATPARSSSLQAAQTVLGVHNGYTSAWFYEFATVGGPLRPLR